MAGPSGIRIVLLAVSYGRMPEQIRVSAFQPSQDRTEPAPVRYSEYRSNTEKGPARFLLRFQ